MGKGRPTAREAYSTALAIVFLGPSTLAEFRGHGAVVAGREIGGEVKVADAFAVQRGDLTADAVEHTAHLPVAAFVEGHTGGVRGEDLELGGQGGEVLSFEIKTLFELRGSGGGDGL